MRERIRGVMLAGTLLAALSGAWVPLASQSARSQAPAALSDASAATGAITGTVVDGATNTPLADVLVYLSGRGVGATLEQPRQLTDGRGRFAFTNLPPSDRYTIEAVKAGYLRLGFGPSEAAAAANSTLTLGAGEWLPDVRVPLWKPGAIGGTVRDEAGEPVVGVRVRLVSRIRVAGRSYLAAGPVTFTDDLGQYRFAGLPPGAYVVFVPSVQSAVPASLPARPQPATAPAEGLLPVDPRVSLSVSTGPVPPPFDGRLLVYPTAFAGGRTVAEATTIDIASGDERDAVDVRLAPVPTSTITGQLIGPAEVMSNLLVRLVPEGLEDLAAGEAAITRPEPDGRFMLVGIPAGTYQLEVPASVSEYLFADVEPRSAFLLRPSTPLVAGHVLPDVEYSSTVSSVGVGPPGTLLVSRSPAGAIYIGGSSVVVTEGATADVTVTLRSLGAIAGRIVLESTRPDTPPPMSVGVSAEGADGSARLPHPANGGRATAPDWAFRLEGFGAGAYRIKATATQPWIVKSIRVGGRDYTDEPVDMATTEEMADVVVTLTDAGAVLSGTVRGEARDRAHGGVLLFPVDRDYWIDYGRQSLRIKTSAVAPDGGYRLTQLPAGDYYVLAIEPSELTAWQEPEFLARAAARAKRVTLAWGDSATLDLRLAGR